MSSSPLWEYEEWFVSIKGTTNQPIVSEETECDSVIEDSYEENSSQIEAPPLDSGFFDV